MLAGTRHSMARSVAPARLAAHAAAPTAVIARTLCVGSIPSRSSSSTGSSSSNTGSSNPAAARVVLAGPSALPTARCVASTAAAVPLLAPHAMLPSPGVDVGACTPAAALAAPCRRCHTWRSQNSVGAPTLATALLASPHAAAASSTCSDASLDVAPAHASRRWLSTLSASRRPFSSQPPSRSE
ncbi:hypothetical protein CAOG_08750, partial [Capsaspora owczarzaki ATCC 30864]